MGNILIDGNGNALISGNKALEVTASVDSNIVPENIKKDVSILGVTGTYEGSGGGGSGTATITNPKNGAYIGTTTSSGVITHQYQVSSGTITDAFLVVGNNGNGGWGTFNSNNTATDGTFPYKKIAKDRDWIEYDLSSNPNIVEISSSGLLSVNYNRDQSDVSHYNWSSNTPVMVCLILNTGQFLYDTIGVYTNYECFVSDTLITLSNGSKKKVQDITYGDELLVWDFDNGKLSSAYPLWLTKTQVANHYHRVYLSDGTEMKLVGTVGYHRLYNMEEGCFTQSVNMTGKKTIKEDGTIIEVLGWENVEEPVEFYNLITDYHINCYAEGILTSCRYSNIYPISKEMKYIKDNRQLIPFETFEGKISEKYYYGLRISEQKFKIDEITKYCLNMANKTK